MQASRRAFLASVAGGAGLVACGPARQNAPAYDGEVAFAHGIASGDPLQTQLIIWTRVSPVQAGPVPVLWVVAKDPGLKSVVRQGIFSTGPDRDYTVKVDVDGLKPNESYHYGFFVGKTASPVGKTRTLPKGGVSKFTLGVVSCSNYPGGFFNAYEALSKRTDVDLVLHLGDYIYEYGIDGYAGEIGAQIGRNVNPPVEIVTLSDYRLRHAQYKSDPDLQAAHAAFPWITTWDDHETTNNSWTDGAENHNPEQNEGDWGARKVAAVQAYFEWMPIREPAIGGVREAIFRSFEIGDLATLAMLETRLTGRAEMFDYDTLFTRADAPLISMAFDFSDPLAPRPATPEQIAANSPVVRQVPLPFDMTGPMPQPIADYARIVRLNPRALPPGIAFLPDKEKIEKLFADPARRMMSQAQEEWLADVLKASRKARKPWQILGNQVIMARIHSPDLTGLPEKTKAALVAAYPGIARLIAASKLALPTNPDAWDGYAAARSRLYEIATREEAHLLVVTGDTHESYMNQLMSEDGKTRLGVEIGATSVSSPSYGDLFASVPDFDLGAMLAQANDEVLWNDGVSKGFAVVTLERNRARAEFVAVSDTLSKDYQTVTMRAYSMEPVAGGGVSQPVLEAQEKAAGKT